MTWLATIGCTAAVCGAVRDSDGRGGCVSGDATAGAGSIKTVAPGIAEALITTAAGLFVAVPAVVAYNQFSARIRLFASATDDFCRELLNSLEEMPVRQQAPAPSASVGGCAARSRAQSIQEGRAGDPPAAQKAHGE